MARVSASAAGRRAGPGVGSAPTRPLSRLAWSDFGAVVPFLDQPARRWKEQPWKTLLKYIGMPVTVPLYILWLFFNRLTVWTAQKVEWPQHIVDAIGPLVTELDLRTDKHSGLRPGSPPEM